MIEKFHINFMSVKSVSFKAIMVIQPNFLTAHKRLFCGKYWISGTIDVGQYHHNFGACVNLVLLTYLSVVVIIIIINIIIIIIIIIYFKNFHVLRKETIPFTSVISEQNESKAHCVSFRGPKFWRLQELTKNSI